MFDSFAAGFLELKPAYMAEILMTSAKTIKRNYGMETNPSEEDFRELFAALIAGQITKESVLDVLKENIPVAEAIHKHHTIPDTELRTILKKIVQENPGQQFNTLTGIAMKQLRGMAQGEKITRFLKALTG
jgi:Glu-tRNA(Gln) amidotransferase subunit E-like FAD-binding protein